MFIDTTNSSKGHVIVYADQRGSYGEIVTTQVGRNYVSVDSAMRAAYRLATTKGMTGVVVRNLNNGWRHTVTP